MHALQHGGLKAPQRPPRPQQQQHQAGHPGGGALQAHHVGQQGQQHHHRQQQRHAGQQGHLHQALLPATHPAIAHVARVQVKAARARRRLAAHLGIQGFGGRNFCRAGLGAHRHVSAWLAAFHDGSDVGTHPVVVAVLAPVFHQTCPGLAPANGAPHVLVGLWRHVRVANDVVRLADEFVVAVATDAHKRRVAVRDLALGVGAGHQQLITGVVKILLGHWQVDAHSRLLEGLRQGQAARCFVRRSCNRLIRIKSNCSLPRFAPKRCRVRDGLHNPPEAHTPQPYSCGVKRAAPCPCPHPPAACAGCSQLRHGSADRARAPRRAAPACWPARPAGAGACPAARA